MQLTHMMLDLETWGTRPGCALRSIGAVMFDPFGSAIGETFYRNIDLNMQDDLKVDSKTLKWWKEQAKEARDALAVDPIPLIVAADRFEAFWKSTGAQLVWCHGASFDAPIWEYAAHTVGYPVPWKYDAVRDTRTLYHLRDFDVKSVPFEGIKHSALDDAIQQAKCVQVAMRK